MHRIKLEQLREASLRKPVGYSDEVISQGQIEGDVLLLDDAVYRKLRAKYYTPSLAQKARNLAGAGARVAKALAHQQRITVPTQERDRRMEICKTCEFFTGSTCRKCGCTIRFKAILQTEHCPIQKW